MAFKAPDSFKTNNVKVTNAVSDSSDSQCKFCAWMVSYTFCICCRKRVVEIMELSCKSVSRDFESQNLSVPRTLVNLLFQRHRE